MVCSVRAADGEGSEVGGVVVQVSVVARVQSVVHDAPLTPVHTLEQDGHSGGGHGPSGGHETQQDSTQR